MSSARVAEEAAGHAKSLEAAGPRGPRGLIAVDKVANRIRFYDPVSLAETKVLEGPEPTVHELALSGDRAFIPLYGSGIYGDNTNPNNKILAVDLERQEVAGIIDLGGFVAPHGMVVTRDGNLWVVCDIARALLRIDPTLGAVAAAFECPGTGPHLVATLPDSSKLYVSHKEGAVGVFDVRRGAFVRQIAIGNPAVAVGNGSGGEGLAVSPDGTRLVVVDNDRSDLRVIDTQSDQEVDRVPLIMHPPTNRDRSRLAKPFFSADASHLVVTSYATGLVWIAEGSDFRRQTIVPVAKGPMGVAFMPDGATFVVSSHDSGILTRIELASGRVVGSYEGGAGIEVMALY